MPLHFALAIGTALIGLAVAIGCAWRAREGRIGAAKPLVLGANFREFGGLGERATLLQFSTEFCAPCKTTARALEAVVSDFVGVTHVDVDLTDHPDAVKRFNIAQTPTTIILDATGRARARIGGAPRMSDLVHELSRVLEENHAA